MISDLNKYLDLISQVENRINRLNEAYIQFKKDNTALNEVIQQKNQIIEELTEKKNHLDREVIALKESFTSEKIQMQNQIDNLNEKIENFNQVTPVKTDNADEIKGIVREIDDCIELIKSSL